MIKALTRHWPKYLMEGIELGDFMIAACIVATLLEYPASPVRQAITAPFSLYVLIGLARTRLGHLLTAAALSFLRLGEWFMDVPRAKTRHSPFATLMTDLIAA